MSFYPGRADYQDGIISVDQALNTPELIEQQVAEVASKNLLVETIFSTDTTPVQGGAVIYSETTQKNFYTDNDVTARAPGDEYTVVYRERPEAQLARVEDYGGKFAVTDEARRRNYNVDFDNDVTALANTITRKLNQRAMETILAAEEAGDVPVFEGGMPLHKVRLDGDPTKITPPVQRPHAAIATMQAIADSFDLGIQYTKMLVSPITRAGLQAIYGAGLQDMLASFNLELLTTNFIDDNGRDDNGNLKTEKLYLVDPGKAGFVKYEEPLTITTWRDEHKRQTWVQGYAMPVMGITMPAAIGVVELVDALA